MAGRFFDSFDHLASIDILDKWTSGITLGGVPADFSINLVNQRTGRACGAFTRNGLAKTIDNQSTWIIGAALQFQDFGGGFEIIKVGTVQVSMGLQADGTFIVANGPLDLSSGNVLGQTSPASAISLNRYYFVEFKAKIDHDFGTAEVRINGQSVLALTNVNTSRSAVNLADVIAVRGPGGGSFVFVDDFQVYDNTTAFNNDFQGDKRIGLLITTSDGDHQDWTPSAAGAHFSLVNDIPPDGDSSYVSSNTVNQIDTYHFQQVDPTLLISAIQTNIIARKDDAGNRSLSLVSRASGVDSVADPGGRFTNLTYLDYLNQFDTNPFTGLAWTAADINAMQWGVKLIS